LASVKVGIDPATGIGGLDAAVGAANATQIDATSPANLSKTKGYFGDVAVLVRNPSGQSAIALGLLRYAPSIVKSGNVTGAISQPGEVDTVFLDTIAGTVLTVTASAAPKSLLAPQIVVKDPNDATVATVGSPGVPKAAVTALALALTGRYRIEVSGAGGSAGGYKLSVKEALPKSQASVKIPTKPPTVVGPGMQSFGFLAKKGSILKGTIVAKGGLLPMVATLDGPSGSILGDPDVSSKIVVSPTGTSISFKSVPLKELGAYTLTIAANGGTTGTISGTLTITPPKSVTTFLEK
jgi:hypothetical protein